MAEPAQSSGSLPSWLERLTGGISRLSCAVVRWLYRGVQFIAAIFGPIARLIDRSAPVLVATRVSLLTVGLGFVLVAFTEQGQDLIHSANAVDAYSLWPKIFFYTAALWLGLQAWYWARISLRDMPPRQHPPYRWLIDNLPRIYGIMPFLAAAVGEWRLRGEWSAVFSTHVILPLIFAVLFYLFLWSRHKLWANQEKIDKHKHKRWAAVVDGASRTRSCLLPGETIDEANKGLPVGGMLLLTTSLGVAVATFVIISAAPVAPAQFFGAAAVAYTAFGSIIAGLSLVAYLARHSRFPLLIALGVWAFIISYWNDNHALQPVASDANANRLTVADSLKKWLEQPAVKETQGPVPIVFVMAEGGASRSAYWTGQVLGRLRAVDSQFVNRIFVISGVSGGALGAVFFDSLVARNQTELAVGMDRLAGQDFLAPVVAGMLYPDLAQRFLPLPQSISLPDRARALERSWEEAWDNFDSDGKLGPNPMAAPFLSLWNDKAAWLPGLLLTGTHVETGKRIITSNLRIEPAVFDDAVDFHDLIKFDIAASTAAHNSARFPLISPPGRIIDGDGVKHGHIIDGGYFENYGAEAIADIFIALHMPGKVRDALAGRELKPIFIEITNDLARIGCEDNTRWISKEQDLVVPATSALRNDSSDEALSCASRSDRLAGRPPYDGPAASRTKEVWNPVRGLYRSRSARGILGAKRLSRLIEALKGAAMPIYLQFNLCSFDEQSDIAMSWALSTDSKRLMRDILDESKSATSVLKDDQCVKDTRDKITEYLKHVKP